MKHQDVKPRSGAGAATPTFAPSSLCSRAVWQVLGPHKSGTCSSVLRGGPHACPGHRVRPEERVSSQRTPGPAAAVPAVPCCPRGPERGGGRGAGTKALCERGQGTACPSRPLTTWGILSGASPAWGDTSQARSFAVAVPDGVVLGLSGQIRPSLPWKGVKVSGPTGAQAARSPLMRLHVALSHACSGRPCPPSKLPLPCALGRGRRVRGHCTPLGASAT